ATWGPGSQAGRRGVFAFVGTRVLISGAGPRRWTRPRRWSIVPTMQVFPARRGVAALALLVWAAACSSDGDPGLPDDDAGRGGGSGGGGSGGGLGDGGSAGGGSGGTGGGGTGDGAAGGAAGGGAVDSGVVQPPPAGVVAAGVRWFGRVDTTNAAQPKFSWSGT